MLFYIQNIDDQHWILLVAVNPSYMLMRVSGVELDDSQENIMYGYLYIDSMETNQHDGSMRADGTDDPTAN